MDVALTDNVLEAARLAGADAVGVTSASPLVEARKALWLSIDQGRAGHLRFTYEDPEIATEVTRTHPWARSLISIGRSYVGRASPPQASGPIVGRFATADHYEAVREVAAAVSSVLESHGHQAGVLIDDNRMVDRSVAARSGTGWLGRNTMLLTPGQGPWMLLGTVATDAGLRPTPAMRRDCGTCTACLPACPTAALSDRGLDARRCISTWLQSPGPIPHWIRPAIGRRIYGCDDCLTACPPGHKALRANDARSTSDSFEDLLSLADEDLVRRFHWWYIPRRDGRYVRRNLLIAAGNSGEMDAVDSLQLHLTHKSSLIRGVAAWSLARSLGEDALPRLRAMNSEETAPETREELRLATLMVLDHSIYEDEVGNGPI